MTKVEPYLKKTRLLNYDATSIRQLTNGRRWKALAEHDRIGAAYNFVRDEIAFGYNRFDDIQASEVLEDGYGQCNTKGTLLMALLRSVGIRCRLHGFTIHKALQRGIVPELVYPLAPSEILHSWVEVETVEGWVNLEGFILDTSFLQTLQRKFGDEEALCGFGVATECLSAPPIGWNGTDTYIQDNGIVRDLGTFDEPDEFFSEYRQDFGFLRNWLFRRFIRHWMNARVRAIRSGKLPRDSQSSRRNHSHEEADRAA